MIDGGPKVWGAALKPVCRPLAADDFDRRRHVHWVGCRPLAQVGCAVQRASQPQQAYASERCQSDKQPGDQAEKEGAAPSVA